jgi:hypothetical protein
VTAGDSRDEKGRARFFALIPDQVTIGCILIFKDYFSPMFVSYYNFLVLNF